MELLLDWLRYSGDVFIFNLLAQVTVLLGAALLVAYWFRHSPVSKYTVLYSSMLSLLLIISVSTLLQIRQTALFSFDVSTLSGSTGNKSVGFILETLPFLLDINELLFDGAVLNQNAQQEEITAQSSASMVSTSLPLSAWFLSGWIAGFVIALLGLVRCQIKLNRLVRKSKSLTSQQTKRVLNALSNIEMAALAVEFKILPSIKSPLLAGIATPTVYLPEAFVENISLGELQAVLLHEVAHLQRKDVAANYIQKIVRAMFWFHPLVILVDRLIDRSREEICDNYALVKSDPISYGEVLFKVGTLRHEDQRANESLSSLALGIHGKNWKLEDRVQGLLDNNRETDMNLSKRKSTLFFTSIVSTAVFVSACQLGERPSQGAAVESAAAGPSATLSQQSASAEPQYISVQSPSQNETREPPPARTGQTLSDEVLAILSEISPLLSTDDNDESKNAENLARAKRLLDQLTTEKFDSLNDFEKASSLNYLTNYYLLQKDYSNSIVTFERILEIGELRADIRLRALRSLGQLSAAMERWQDSIDFYAAWRELAAAEDQLVFKGLSYAHYQLEELAPAIQYWESYMELMESNDITIDRDDFAYLNGMYFAIEDLNKALELTKEMILKFNDARDWNNLKSIYAMMDAQEQADQAVKALHDIVGDDIAGVTIEKATHLLTDGDYLPLIAVAPQYPTQAANEGIEGWTLVGFTVLEDGSVDQQSISVIDAEPLQLFDRTSMRAAAQFKFQPRVLNGQAVKVVGVQYVFRFQLNEEA